MNRRLKTATGDHVREQLPQFIDHDLRSAERHLVGEHLLHCEACRQEHDSLKLGARLASTLGRRDAPTELWHGVIAGVDRERATSRASAPFFTFAKACSFGATVLVVGLISVLIYRGLFIASAPEVVRQEPTTGSPVLPPASERATEVGPPANAVIPETAPRITANGADQASNVSIPDALGPQWQVETLAGSPRINAGTSADKLTVGAELVTDAHSRAKVDVADIGMVEVAPNSRVRLLGTSKQQHRLSLEQGQLHAKISAPPRLFVVETPSAAAVDLGCEYTLEVDKAGNTILNVKLGYVSLERAGLESIVPAGAVCLTNNGRLGTPFSAETSDEFRAALERFDFRSGGSKAIDDVLAKRQFYDMITLWHLLTRVGAADRGRVFDALAGYVRPPDGVTRDGILKRDAKMLEVWHQRVEAAWFDL